MDGTFRWLRTGHEALTKMLAAIEEASVSIRLETYIFAAGGIGEKFREALIRASQRGVKVRVLVDAMGSIFLPADFWQPLIDAGGEFKLFNPLSLHRLSYRNHRKLLVCDERFAFVGGFNLADDYDGDGVKHGWRDLGLEILGAPVPALVRAFDQIFETVASHQKRWGLLNKTHTKLESEGEGWRLLLSGPGRLGVHLRRILRSDIAKARDVKIICAYFLPTWRLRKAMARVCRSGGHVQLILAGKSDVGVSHLASRRLYQSLLRSGVEIFEYQPQILHAKLLIIDDLVCVGSANLDTRSLIINHELLMRVCDKKLSDEAREIFEHDLAYCRRIDPSKWQKSRSFWTRWLERAAYFVLAHVDPYVARLQLKFFRQRDQAQSTPASARASRSDA